MLSHVGLSKSYSTLTAKIGPTVNGIKTIGRKTPGTIQQLSQAMRQNGRKWAAAVTYGEMYDNINFADKVAEQVVGRTSERSFFLAVISSQL